MRINTMPLKATDIAVCAKRSDNKTFEYEATNWRVTKLAGLDAPPIEVFSDKKGQGHGSYITGVRYDARDIDISARSQLKANIVADRSDAVDFHQLDYTYTLYIYFMNSFAKIENCRLQGFKCDNKNTYKRCEMEVSFLCPDPMMVTGQYETKTIQANGDASGDYHYYPLATCYSEEAMIRKVEFTATEQINDFAIGPFKSSVILYSNEKIFTGQKVTIIVSREDWTISIYADGILRKKSSISTSTAEGFMTKGGTSSRERFMLIVNYAGANPTQPDLQITYANAKSNAARGI